MKTTPLKTTLAVIISLPILLLLVGFDLFKFPVMAMLGIFFGFINLVVWLRAGCTIPYCLPVFKESLFLFTTIWFEMLRFPTPSWMN